MILKLTLTINLKYMTREIKFRAWDNFNKSFIEDDEYLIGLNGKFYRMDFYPGIENYEDGNLVWDELQNITLSQFTGLLDKNGKEIYEKMEIDNKFIVDFQNGSYILRNISNNNIIYFYDYIKQNEKLPEITREYSEI